MKLIKIITITILLTGKLYSNEIGDEIFFCNFDTGMIESGIIKEFDYVPAYGKDKQIILTTGLVIHNTWVIDLPIKGNCI